MSDYREKVVNHVKDMQQRITASLEALEGKSFAYDHWTRPDEHGQGQVNLMQNGSVFEKGGVNYTEMDIPLSRSLATLMAERGKNIEQAHLSSYNLFAVGVSLVIHPKSPKIPTIHANYRYLELTLNEQVKDWWFAGGTDLTPYYLDEADCILFHSSLKQACDYLDPEFYSKHKKECDDYFLIQHRKMRRGVGGIFFDDVNGFDVDTLIEFQKRCADALIQTYEAIVRKHVNEEYSKEERRWQKIRRGHYVEFNIAYDRGTKFGLVTPDANIEAILMPCPLKARWEYKYRVGEEEEKLVQVLRCPREWV